MSTVVHGKWYWMFRGLLTGLTFAWLIEIETYDGIGPMHRYVAPFVIASLIALPFYEMWRSLRQTAAKKSN